VVHRVLSLSNTGFHRGCPFKINLILLKNRHSVGDDSINLLKKDKSIYKFPLFSLVIIRGFIKKSFFSKRLIKFQEIFEKVN